MNFPAYVNIKSAFAGSGSQLVVEQVLLRPAGIWAKSLTEQIAQCLVDARRQRFRCEIWPEQADPDLADMRIHRHCVIVAEAEEADAVCNLCTYAE